MNALLGQIGLLSARLLAQGSDRGWMPKQRSTIAPEVDAIFDFILVVSVFFFLLIVGAALYFIIRYRRREGDPMPGGATHNIPLELLWTGIPVVLVCIMFWWGFKVFVDMRTPPDNAYEISVRAQQWSWEFWYPNGISYDELHVPANQPVKLVMTSEDVLHSFYVPEFRVKMDVIPGRYTTTWFEALYDDEGSNEYPLICAEYCGTDHSSMITKVVVHTDDGFVDWLANADPLAAIPEELWPEYEKDPDKFIKDHPEIKGLKTPALMGEKLYKRKGCSQCHSTDGTRVTGPSFLGIYGKQEEMEDGTTVTVDANYIEESILNPNAKVVKTYPRGQMNSYQGRITDREIAMLIEYIKSLGQK